MKREYIEKATSETREVVQSLLDENQRLSGRVGDLLVEIEEQSLRFSERFVEIEEQNTKLANLYVASYQLNGTLDRAQVVGAIQEIIVNLIGCEQLAIWEIDNGVLNLVASFGIDASTWASIPLGSGLIGAVALMGERYIPDDMEREIVACIPLKLDERVIGAIGIFSLLQQKQGLEPLDYELFDLLASHAASALFCTRLYAEYVQ